MIDEIFQQYWLLAVFIVFVIYQVLSHLLFKSALNRVGGEFCVENGFQFIEIKHSKSHFSVVYKTDEDNKRRYKKFRMNAFLGKITYLEWLK